MIKRKFKELKKVVTDWADDVWTDSEDLYYDHPRLFGFLIGCVIVYVQLIGSCIIQGFRGKELDWVDKK